MNLTRPHGPSEWALSHDNLDDERLQNIPGLRQDRTNGCVLGDVGAVAAACFRLGLPVPPRPEIPSGLIPVFTIGLRRYQLEGVGWLREVVARHGGALLADDMGLGKSRQSIALATTLRMGRTLVVCPGRARETWLEEMLKYGIGRQSIALMLPKNDKRHEEEQAKTKTARFVVSSYDLAPRLGSWMGGMVIFDEIHELKGRKNKLGKELEALCLLAQYKLGLTGTPDYDRPRDYYAQLKLLLGWRFGSAYEFDVAYCGGFHDEMNHFQNKGGGGRAAEELKLRLSYYMLRREKREVLDELPALDYQPIWLDPDAVATRARQAMRYTAQGMHQALLATAEAKMKPCVELAAQAGRFLMFTWTKEMARQLQAMCIAQGVRCVRIDGDMPHAKRQAAIHEAEDKRQGMVATLDAAGQSLNLQHLASTGIFHALPWSPGKLVQARDRIYRMGQSEPVRWLIPILRDSADELVLKKVITKLGLFVSNKQATAEVRAMRDALDSGPQQEVNDAEAFNRYYEEMGEEED